MHLDNRQLEGREVLVYDQNLHNQLLSIHQCMRDLLGFVLQGSGLLTGQACSRPTLLYSVGPASSFLRLATTSIIFLPYIVDIQECGHCTLSNREEVGVVEDINFSTTGSWLQLGLLEHHAKAVRKLDNPAQRSRQIRSNNLLLSSHLHVLGTRITMAYQSCFPALINQSDAFSPATSAACVVSVHLDAKSTSPRTKLTPDIVIM